MIIMPANHSSPVIHYLAGRHPGKLGWLVGPSATSKTKLRSWVPYALDNDAFSAWTKGTSWSAPAWRQMLLWASDSGQEPRWCLVPDVVGNREETLQRWKQYSPEARAFGWPLAFAVQDGMTSRDVPQDAEVVFVGGTTDWKWATVPMWAAIFSRVHVGRVNSIEKLRVCDRLGVESVDGTGWFRDESRLDKVAALVAWLEEGR